jgi:hypothetical protein
MDKYILFQPLLVMELILDSDKLGEHQIFSEDMWLSPEEGARIHGTYNSFLKFNV